MKRTKEKIIKDLFDPIEREKRRQEYYKTIFGRQDEFAKKSKVFKAILQSEIKVDPEERLLSTHGPQSKTRNALILRSIFETQEAWEQDLLNDSFFNTG